MVAHETRHGSRIEDSLGSDPGWREVLVDQWPQLVFEPPGNRSVETTLGVLQGLYRQHPAHGPLQEMLEFQARHLEMTWKAKHELNHAVIEERHPYFERMSHAHAVDLDQDVIGEVCARVHVEKRVEEIVMPHLIVVPLEDGIRVQRAVESREN